MQIKKLITFIKWFIDKLNRDRSFAYSAMISFFIIISIFPFIFLVLTILRFTPLTEEVFVQVVNSLIPGSFATTVSSWIGEAYSYSGNALLSFSIIAILWTSSKGFMGLIQGINITYEIKESRNYFILRGLSIIYTIVFSIMLIVALGLLVYGNQIVLSIVRLLPGFESYTGIVMSLRLIFVMIIFIVVFALIFKIIPNTKSKMRETLPGAIVAAFGWIGFSYLYSLYIDNYKSTIYGSLTNIILLMLWLYMVMNIVFIGGCLNVYVKQHPANKSITSSPDSND